MTPEERLANAIEDLQSYRDGLELTFQHDAADRIRIITQSIALARNAIMKKRAVRKQQPLKLVISKP